MLDISVFGSVDRISPEAPVPIIRQENTIESGGGAANVALNIVAMGGTAHLVTCVAADPEGERLVQLLRHAGVTVDIVATPGRPTTVKTRFLARHNQLLRLDREVTTPITPACEARIIAALQAQMDRCRLVILSDYAKGLVTDRVIEATFSLTAKAGVPVIVDPKRRNLADYRGASFIKPNRRELEAATNLPVTNDRQVEVAAASLATATGAILLVTRSEDGMSLVRPDGSAIHMPTHAHEIVDVTGAGDAAIAAFSLAIAECRSAEEAMAFANIAAGISVIKQGTTTVSAPEIEHERAVFAGQLPVPKGSRVSVETALLLRAQWRQQRLTVGFTNGCFDLFHPGHVALLRETARQCDRLIVGLNSDASVRRLKGETRPVQNEEARAEILGAIGHVDLVVVFAEDTPRDLIARLEPDLLTKGADYKVEDIVGGDIVRQAGGRVLSVDLVPGHSSTHLINRR
jgi:D-beta-D-heptose 7-phosphate kinase/D-beta-D-heptose 1-phosphate adenosyltransferase